MKIPKARQLPSGSWFVRVGINGQYINITKSTKKEAEAEAAALKAGVKQAAVDTKEKTLGRAIDEYIDARRNVLSPATIRGYCVIRNNRFQSAMKMKIGSIRPEKWQSIVNAEAKVVSAKTLKNSWGLISSVIHSATGQIITVRLPQVIANQRQFLDPEQIPVFIQAVHGDPVETTALLALSSLRRSEILALQWEDVDLGKGVLHVHGATVQGDDNKFIRKKETKNTSSRRTVPIIPPLYSILEAQHKHTGPVVTISTGSMFRRINAVCKSAGLPEVGIHGLRHSFASLAYHLQMPEKIAMQIGGWSDNQTMHRIYTHIGQKDLQAQAEKFTDFFASLQP